MDIVEQVLDRAKREGIEIGKKIAADKAREERIEVQAQIVKNLMATANYSIAEIAYLVDVSEDFVLEIINKMTPRTVIHDLSNS